MLRLLMNSLIVLMLCGLTVVVMVQQHSEEVEVRDRETARAMRHRLQQQVSLNSMLSSPEKQQPVYPERVEPSWFEDTPPRNVLIERGHPWIEVASENETHMLHPLRRLAVDKQTAEYWYNPRFGVVRARMPVGLPDEVALDLYNYVNDSQLVSLFPYEADRSNSQSQIAGR